MRGRNIVAVLLAAAVFIFGSCDNFFSESWGKEAARDYKADNIDINAGNVERWLETARGNPKLAEAITEKIKRQLADKSLSNAEKTKLREAGVKFCVEEAELGTFIISKAGTLIDKFQNAKANDIPDILLELKTDYDKIGVPAAKNLAEIVSSGGNITTSNLGVPTFSDKSAAPSDVGQAVLVLALAIFKADELKDLNNLNKVAEKSEDFHLRIDNGNGNAVWLTDEANAAPEQKALAAYLNLIKDDKMGKYNNNPITSAIKGAFGLGTSAPQVVPQVL